jgi:hypothetical protein
MRKSKKLREMSNQETEIEEEREKENKNVKKEVK